jgi:two-component system, response regulator
MSKAEILRGILLIEDNPDDFEATVRSFKKAGLVNPLHWCTSGQEALDYLHQTGKYASNAGSELPALILLDLNMPGLDGRALLELLKQEKLLRRIPVVILTTSTDARDIDRCYELGASTYIQKPVDFDGLVRVAKVIRDYWFGIALVPKEEERW